IFHSGDPMSDDLVRRLCKESVGLMWRIPTDPMESEKEKRNEVIFKIFELLSILIRVDFDIVAIWCHDIFLASLHNIVQSPSDTSSVLEFFSLHLSYCTKTRALDQHIHLLANIFEHLPDRLRRQSLPGIFASPLFGRQYGALLLDNLKSFSTPTQILSSFNEVLACLNRSYDGFRANSKGSLHRQDKRKSRPKSTEGSCVADNAEDPSVVPPILLLHLLRICVQSLPSYVAKLKPEDADKLRNQIHSLESLIHSGVATTIDTLQMTGNATIAASLLNVCYILGETGLGGVSEFQGPLEPGVVHPILKGCEDHLTGILSTIDKPQLPYLTVESARIIFQQLWQTSENGSHRVLVLDATFSSTFFESLVAALEREEIPANVSGAVHSSSYLGNSDVSRQAGFVALWDLVTDRWLAVVDLYATQSQLGRLVKRIFRLYRQQDNHANTAASMTAGAVIQRALSNASFWEHTRIRDVILGQFGERAKTSDPSRLLKFDVTPLGLRRMGRSLLRLSPSILQSKDNEATLEMFNFLMVTPMEYIPKPIGDWLMKAALVADSSLGSLEWGEMGEDEWAMLMTKRTLFRSYLLRMVNKPRLPSDLRREPTLLPYLCRDVGDEAGLCARTSLELIKSISLTMIKPSGTSGDNLAPITIMLDLLENLLSNLASCSNISNWDAEVTATLLDAFASHLQIPSTPEHVLGRLRSLTNRGLTFTERLHDTPISDTLYPILVNIRRLLLLIRRLIGETDVSGASPPSGRQLLTALFRNIRAKTETDTAQSPNWSSLCATIFSLVSEEFKNFSPVEKQQELEYLVSADLALRCLLQGPHAERDPAIANCSHELSTAAYGHVLQRLYHTMMDSAQSPKLVFAMISQAAILVTNPPPDSHQVAKSFRSHYLCLLSSFKLLGANDRLLSLDYIVKCFFKDTVPSLFQTDLNYIWLILADTLSPSTSHDTTTSKSIYLQIASIARQLVNSRRDLVVNSLPHLGHILSRLLECLRAVRGSLGASQQRSIASTFPSWIQPSQPLGAEEANSITRLLMTLTKRTEVQTSSSANKSKPIPQAESIARPFSTQAPYVLVAYIRILTSPLGILSPDIRRGLEPGIFELCSMINDQMRDSMMITMLDGGEREMLKLIWDGYIKRNKVGRR
ncbi:Urb2/Npa2 family-domain-containing protein, partial [Cantharellus anzutake]|uniref:Urb2/Npa2 family-domain-containing protein n=1 Tax=Cantharellus anzutake TaxID=1750568 RepID=UPI001908A0CC